MTGDKTNRLSTSSSKPISSFAKQLGILACLVSASLLLAPFEARSQQATDPLRRTVAVSVMTDKGEVVKGLDASHFRGTFRKKPVENLSVVESPPHRVVILFDTSGSMRSQRQMPLLLIVGAILNSTAGSIPASFVTFSGRVETETKLEVDRSRAWAEVRKLETESWDVSTPKTVRKTALLDAIVEALRLLEPAQLGDSIAVVSDGGENASKIGWGDLRRAVRRSGVRVYMLGTVVDLASRSRTPEEEVGPGALSDLAKETGGDYWIYNMDEFKSLTLDWLKTHRSESDIRLTPLGPARMISQEMSAFYSLNIRLPEAVDSPRKWQLEVVDPKTGKPDHHLVLHYPSQLLPSASAGP